MRIFLKTLLLGFFISLLVVIYRTPYSQCDAPKAWKIGNIDSRFGLDQKEAVSKVTDASDILSSAYGKELFRYSANEEGIMVNFVYDERTALEENISEQENQINESNHSLQEKVDDYDKDVMNFEQRLNAYNTTVQMYNEKGTVTQEVYDQLTAEKKALEAEGNSLNQRARQLNLDTNNYNLSVDDLNQNVSAFNRALSEKPEEGLYNGRDRTITIYFVNNEPELIHTLAHEFGHALSMNHVDDPEAIMYHLSSKSVQISDDDRRELARVCQSIPLPKQWTFLMFQKYYDLVGYPQ